MADPMDVRSKIIHLYIVIHLYTVSLLSYMDRGFFSNVCASNMRVEGHSPGKKGSTVGNFMGIIFT